MEDENRPEDEAPSVEPDHENLQNKPAKASFVLEIINAIDIPYFDKTKSDPYIQAFLVAPVEGDPERLQRRGIVVTTPIRYDCSEVVWNSFRDLRVSPTPESILTIEIYHHHKDVHKSDFLLGKVDFPVRSLTDVNPITLPFVNFKVTIPMNVLEFV